MINLPHIGRETSGIPVDAFAQLRTQFQKLAVREGFSKNMKQSLRSNKYADRISLLSIGHLQRFIRINGLVVAQSDLDELSGFLENVLPSRFDDPMTKPALPGSIMTFRERKRVLFIAPCDELDAERSLVQDAVSSFFGEKTKALSPNSWTGSPLPTGYEIASVSHPYSADVIDLANSALENTPLFRDMQVTYEPADIAMVALKENRANLTKD